jgi:hypothetical protein
MSIDNQTKINAYINKFKGTKNLFKSYNEFDLEWLNSFDERKVENIKKKLDYVSYEMIFGNGDYNNIVLEDFIISLEDLKNDIIIKKFKK